MDFQKFAARTVDEAITKACVELAIPSDKLEYEVETEGREGFFGIGSRNAVIRARVKEAEKEAPEEAAPVTAEAEPEKAQPPKQEKAPKNEEKKPRVKTAEEIEAMAQAAAKRAAEAGEVPEEKEPAPRREKKNDRRSDRRRGQKTREKRPVPEVREKEADEAALSAAPGPHRGRDRGNDARRRHIPYGRLRRDGNDRRKGYPLRQGDRGPEL